MHLSELSSPLQPQHIRAPLFDYKYAFNMARYNGYAVPDEFSLEFLPDSQFLDNQDIYQSQQFMSDPNPWAQQPPTMGHHLLEQQSMSNTQYDLPQIDPALWQYTDEQDLVSGDMVGHLHEPQEDTVIDPQLRTTAHRETGASSIMVPCTSSNSHRRTPSREPERPNPSKQAPSQLFVVPFTEQDNHAAFFPDSNNMFCDFPGVAFRSFLPKGATTPVSTGRLQPNSYEPTRAMRKAQKTSMRKQAAMQDSSQSQMAGPSQGKTPGQGGYSSSNSTPYASGSSFSTPDFR